MDESERQACGMYLAFLIAALVGVAGLLWVAAFRPGTATDARIALGTLACCGITYQGVFSGFRDLL